MAERIFRKRSGGYGRSDIEVSSASLLDMKGAPSDPKVVDLLEEKGFNGHGHRSKLLTEDMVSETDKILVMEQQHIEMIVERYPEVKKKVFLLKPFSSGRNQSDSIDLDIADPYGRSSYHYRLCFAEIYMAVEGVLKCI